MRTSGNAATTALSRDSIPQIRRPPLEIPGETGSAKAYLEKAAGQANPEARELLESFLETPEPAPAALEESLAAAIAGDARAQYQIGFAHYMGTGVPRSLPQSYFWFSVLARRMPGQAAGMLQLLSTQLSAEAREKLDQKVQGWTPGQPPDVQT